MKIRLTAAAIVALMVITGCSDDDDGQTVTAGDGTEQTVDDAASPGDSTGDDGDCRTAEEARTAEAPDLEAPNAKATELEITDLEVGCGAEIPEGSVVTVEVNYMGKAHSTGEQFDSSFDRGTPISFDVGAGRLIQGWDVGMAGMKEGGRRQLLIPGDLAYGPRGNPPDIGPDDTLVFVIDLLSVQ